MEREIHVGGVTCEGYLIYSYDSFVIPPKGVINQKLSFIEIHFTQNHFGKQLFPSTLSPIKPNN